MGRLHCMPVQLSRNDARRAAMACRSLASLNRSDAVRQSAPHLVESKQREAAELDRLAALFDAHAEGAPTGTVVPFMR